MICDVAQDIPVEVEQKPLVSIVIAAHNQEEEARRALTAIGAAAERERLEVLLVDCGSRDGTGRLDGDFPEITVLRLPKNFGRTRARNIATRSAQSELVLYLDPRVEVGPETIGKMAAALESHEEWTAVAAVLSNETQGRVEVGHVLPTAEQLKAASLGRVALERVSGDTAPAAEEYAVMIRKTFLLGMNYLDEKRFSECWGLLEVFWQIRNAGKKVGLVDAGGVVHGEDEGWGGDEMLIADAVAAAGAYIGKHEGFGAAISFRLKCFLSALGRGQVGLAWGILSGSRIDPTQ